MKGLSILVTLFLLVLANHVALLLKKAGALPADQPGHHAHPLAVQEALATVPAH